MTTTAAPTWSSRHNRFARARGWRSYAQYRYWTYVTGPWSREKAERLARRICGKQHEPERSGSILCRACNRVVNPYGQERSGDWRARLVNLALHGGVR